MRLVPTIDLHISAEAVAWYAAVVATGSAITSMYVAMRDRPSLRVSVSANMLTFGMGHDNEKKFVVVSVSNVGRRPMTLGLVGLVVNKPSGEVGEYVLTDSTSSGPRPLPEGESTTYKLEQHLLRGHTIRQAIVRDQRGKVWKHRTRIAIADEAAG